MFHENIPLLTKLDVFCNFTNLSIMNAIQYLNTKLLKTLCDLNQIVAKF